MTSLLFQFHHNNSSRRLGISCDQKALSCVQMAMIRFNKAYVFFLSITAFIAVRTNCVRVSENTTVTQHDSVTLSCYSNYSASPEWTMQRVGDEQFVFIYSAWNLQKEFRGIGKYRVDAKSGFCNLTITNVSIADAGEYQCVELGLGHSIFLRVNDSDECQLKVNGCSQNATCINTYGSYACECLSGFVGNGRFRCDDINECNNSMACGVNAFCINTIGNFTCTCYHGYKKLQLIDACTVISDVNEVVGANVTLPCHSANWVVWRFVASPDAVHGTYLNRDGKTTVDKMNTSFVDAYAGNYTIVLLNVESNHSGYYVCTNETGEVIVSYYLNITETGKSPVKLSASTVAVPVVLAAVVAIGLIGLIVVVVHLFRRRRRQRKSKSRRDENRLLPSDNNVVAVASFDDRLCVIKGSSSTVGVYNVTPPFNQLENIRLDSLVHPTDIATCKATQCIYISDYENKCVWRIDRSSSSTPPPNKVIECINYRPSTLFTIERHEQLLVTSDDQLHIHNVKDGQLFRSVELAPVDYNAGIEWTIRHAVQATTSEHYFACRTGIFGSTDYAEVAEFNSTGQWLRCYYSGPRSSHLKQLNWPFYLAFIDDHRLLVADNLAVRVLLWNVKLNQKKVILHEELNDGRDDNGLDRICYHSATRQLFVVSNERLNHYRLKNTCRLRDEAIRKCI